jgi:hypothetical protein
MVVACCDFSEKLAALNLRFITISFYESLLVGYNKDAEQTLKVLKVILNVF